MALTRALNPWLNTGTWDVDTTFIQMGSWDQPGD